jgi:Cof subfamily protein (haloacid dehalogenase superfamily)
MAARLVVFDLDGTLLGADNRLSRRTVDALAAARSAGLTLVAASGRGHRAAEMVLKPTRAIDFVVCSNGAVLYERSTRSVLASERIKPERVGWLYETVNQQIPRLCWAWETEKGIVPDDGFRSEGAELDELTAAEPLILPPGEGAPIESRLAELGDTVRILLSHPDMPREDLLRRVEPLVGEAELAVASSSAVFLEITAPGIDKRFGLEALCGRFGFAPHEVIAFGDHHNDLSMLQWAGRGIAVAGGHPDVLAKIAEHTESTHADDGVAETLEKLVAEL